LSGRLRATTSSSEGANQISRSFSGPVAGKTSVSSALLCAELRRRMKQRTFERPGRRVVDDGDGGVRCRGGHLVRTGELL